MVPTQRLVRREVANAVKTQHELVVGIPPCSTHPSKEVVGLVYPFAQAQERARRSNSKSKV